MVDIADVAGGAKAEQFFERGSALALLRRGHPYDFRETYAILRAAYGYRSHYVNLGLWRPDLVPDSAALDPGERLVRFLVAHTAAHAAQGGRALDIGSGLGQGALDLAEHFARVDGVNVNDRQIAFANALAASVGLGERVVHRRVDACSALESTFGRGAFDAAYAVECIGHFADPHAFLVGLRAVLRDGATFTCCLNVAHGALPLSLRALMRATYGFVPRPLDWWRAALERAGLHVVGEGDLTDAVLVDGAAAVRARLATTEVRAAAPALAVRLVELQLALAQRAVQSGELGYAWIVART